MARRYHINVFYSTGAASGYGFHSEPEGHRQFCQVRVVSEGKE